MLQKMKYRSRVDIASEVLQSMSNGNIILTKIMYSSFTSYAQAKEYVAFLHKKGLMRFDAPSTKTTCEPCSAASAPCL